MQDKIIISENYLMELSNELKRKYNVLENIKENRLIPVLKQCGSLTNNATQIDNINKIKSHIAEIEKDLKMLTNKLDSSIIPGYQDTSQSIKKVFNIDFHNEMNDLISKIKTE